MSFEFRDLRCFASPLDGKSYYFLPKTPDLVRDADRQPMLTFFDVGPSGYLIFTAHWDAPEGDLDALRHELALSTSEPDPARIRLSFAPVRSPRCQVLIGDGTGSYQALATSTTSGVPPYDAVFNLVLQNEHLLWARAGLRGEPGFLGIEYRAELDSPVTAGATLRARAEELLPWLSSHGGGSPDLLALLEQAVELGLATVQVEVPDQHASRLTGDLYDRVLAQAARMLPRWTDQSGAGDVEVSATIEQTMSEPVRAFADVGAIVSEESVRPVSGGHHAAN
jgi:hypothetical protein